MAKELNEGTTFKLSIKTLAGIAALIFTLVSMWFILQGDITEAKELPANQWNPEWEEKLPSPDVTRMEFDMKDENIRLTIQNTADDVTEIKEDMKRIEDKIDQLK
jgi:spermidine/putrescine-binding protein